MNCKQANKKISQLIDGLLNEKDKSILLEHINVCDECRKLYDDTSALVNKLKLLPEIPLPEGAQNKIHFALKREAAKPKKKKWIKWTMIAMPATVAVFAAVLGISYIFSGGLAKTNSEDMTAMEIAAPEEKVFSAQKAAPESTMEESSAAGALEAEEPMIADDGVRMDEAADEEIGTTKAPQGESLSVPCPESEFSVNVAFAGDTADEMQSFVESALDSFEDINAQQIIFTEETQSITVYLKIVHYDEFIETVRNAQEANIVSDTALRYSAYDESLLFEVNFLFQKND